MEHGQRIKLISNYRNRYGWQYKKGQTGTICFVMWNGEVVIDLDGYEELRQRAEEFNKKYGEYPNLLEYCEAFPPEILEAIQ